MEKIFLSASVPMPGRGNFHESANPFLIQFAVRELLTATLGRREIVWGGHPAITPMVWAVCEDLGVEYARSVRLYQSRLFTEIFPDENKKFSNVTYVDAVGEDRDLSLRALRENMLSNRFEAAVFIGGMEGVIEEFEIFRDFNPDAKILPVSSPGGAAMQLAQRLDLFNDRIDFARMFYEKLDIDIAEARLRTSEG